MCAPDSVLLTTLTVAAEAALAPVAKRATTSMTATACPSLGGAVRGHARRTREEDIPLPSWLKSDRYSSAAAERALEQGCPRPNLWRLSQAKTRRYMRLRCEAS